METLELTDLPRLQEEAQRIAARWQQALDRAAEARDAGRFGEAEGICWDLVNEAADPAEHPAQGMLGEMLIKRGAHQEGVDRLRRVLMEHPTVWRWQAALGDGYLRLGLWLDALAAADRAVRHGPGEAAPLILLARAFGIAGQDEEVRRCLLKALAIEPENPEARMALGEFLLTHGQLRHGWREYEFRRKVPEVARTIPRLRSAPWNGMAIPGGRIAIMAEGGYGDLIQFARYVPRVAERCKDVVLICPPDIASLFPWDTVTDFALVPPHDAHAFMMSLPGLLDVDTINDIGRTPPASITVRRRPAGGGRMGICWSGSIKHRYAAARNVALRAFRPLLGVQDAKFVCLQRVMTSDDRSEFERNWITRTTVAKMDDWRTTAQSMADLDLVVSVDTAVAHLAGTMGIPTIVLVPSSPEWRWFGGQEKTPWYPSMRIVKQGDEGWAHSIDKFARDSIYISCSRIKTNSAL